MKGEVWRWGAGAWLILRAVSSASAAYSVAAMPSGGVDVPGYSPPQVPGLLAPLVEPWLRADALWYLKIATQGYAADGTLAFFPALPLLTAALRPLTAGNEAIAALLITNLASLVGLMVLFAFFGRLWGSRAARAGVMAVALFPTAFFFVAPYGEALLLFSGSVALLATATNRPGVGFLAGVVAGLSRPFGSLIALPMALAARQRGLKGLIPAAGPVVGVLGWVGYVWRITGNPWGALQVQSGWQRQPTPIWQTVRLGFEQWRQYSTSSFGDYLAFDLAATVFGLLVTVAAGWVLFKRGKSDWALGLVLYAAAVMAAPLLLPFRPRALMSIPRFVLALFPMFVVFGVVPVKARWVLASLSAAGLAVGTAVFIAGRPLF